MGTGTGTLGSSTGYEVYKGASWLQGLTGSGLAGYGGLSQPTALSTMGYGSSGLSYGTIG